MTTADGGPPPNDDRGGGPMPGQIVHFEIPADDTAKGRELWGAARGSESRGPSSRTEGMNQARRRSTVAGAATCAYRQRQQAVETHTARAPRTAARSAH